MPFVTKCRACGFEQVSKVYNNVLNKKDFEIITDDKGRLPSAKEQCDRCNAIFYADYENTRWRD